MYDSIASFHRGAGVASSQWLQVPTALQSFALHLLALHSGMLGWHRSAVDVSRVHHPLIRMSKNVERNKSDFDGVADAANESPARVTGEATSNREAADLSHVKDLCCSRWELRECGRLFHGIAEGLEGLTVDRYGDFCLVQTWRNTLAPVAEDLEGFPGKVVFTPRGSSRPWFGPTMQGEFSELGIRYSFKTPEPGSDPWLFLDFRPARKWLLQFAKGEVLNTFAYTCGAGLAAAKAGANVLNLDHSGSYLDIGRANAQLNSLQMEYMQEDFVSAIRQFAGLKVRQKPKMRRYSPRSFDLIILDPPTKTKGYFGAVDIINDYPSLLKPCLLALSPGGSILATHHSSATTWSAWVDILYRCAEKAGRPIVELERIHVDPDFPSFDDEPPLKMAVLRI